MAEHRVAATCFYSVLFWARTVWRNGTGSELYLDPQNLAATHQEPFRTAFLCSGQ